MLSAELLFNASIKVFGVCSKLARCSVIGAQESDAGPARRPSCIFSRAVGSKCHLCCGWSVGPPAGTGPGRGRPAQGSSTLRTPAHCPACPPRCTAAAKPPLLSEAACAGVSRCSNTRASRAVKLVSVKPAVMDGRAGCSVNVMSYALLLG